MRLFLYHTCSLCVCNLHSLTKFSSFFVFLENPLKRLDGLSNQKKSQIPKRMKILLLVELKHAYVLKAIQK